MSATLPTNSSGILDMTEAKKYLKLRRRDVVPPGGWHYIVPGTTKAILSGYWHTLIADVAKYMSSNEIDIPIDLAEQIEDWICRHIPAELTSDPHQVYAPGKRPLTSHTIETATAIALRAWKNVGRKVVLISEAEERAKICADCKFNISSVSCFSCKGTRQWILQKVQRTTSMDNNLLVCSISGIMNMTHVHMTEEVIRSFSNGNILDNHPDNCWKKKMAR